MKTLAGPLVALATCLVPTLARAEPPALPVLTLAADAGLGARQLTWKDDLFGQLRDYSLPAAPVVGGEVALYPGALLTRGPLAWFGLAGRLEGMPGLRSQRTGHDDVLPTTSWAFSAALRMRAPVRFGAVWAQTGVAGRTFTIGRAGITDPDVPSVRYLGPSFGLGAQIDLRAGLSLSPRGAFSIWAAKGDIASPAWFPGATAANVDLGLRLAWALPRGFAPYLDVAWTRTILALDPEPGDAHVAGGAADDVVGARLGLSWTYAEARPLTGPDR
jgi:hypothetical protein